MNKKGAEVPITVFVFLILFLFVLTLLSFISAKTKIDTGISRAEMIDNVVSEKEMWEASAYKVVLDSYLNSYYKTSGGQITLYDLEQLDNQIRNNIGNLKVRSMSDYEIEKSLSMGDDLTFSLEEFPISASLIDIKEGMALVWGWLPTFTGESKIKAHMAVVYRPEVVINFKPDREGVHSFLDILSAISKCDDNREACLKNNLFNFDVRVFESDSTILYEFTTKREFYIDGEFVPIKIKVTQDL